jgi:hypothetical protein
VHDLFEVSPLPIEESLDDSIGYTQMTRISEISYSFTIFDIYDSDEPVFLTFTVSIDSTFHTDEVVSVWTFQSSMYSSILSACSELFECRGHITDAR